MNPPTPLDSTPRSRRRPSLLLLLALGLGSAACANDEGSVHCAAEIERTGVPCRAIECAPDQACYGKATCRRVPCRTDGFCSGPLSNDGITGGPHAGSEMTGTVTIEPGADHFTVDRGSETATVGGTLPAGVTLPVQAGQEVTIGACEEGALNGYGLVYIRDERGKLLLVAGWGRGAAEPPGRVTIDGLSFDAHVFEAFWYVEWRGLDVFDAQERFALLRR